MKQQTFWLLVIGIAIVSCTVSIESPKEWSKQFEAQRVLIAKYKQSLKDLHQALQTNTDVRESTEAFTEALEQLPLPLRVYYYEQSAPLLSKWRTDAVKSIYKELYENDPYMN